MSTEDDPKPIGKLTWRYYSVLATLAMMSFGPLLVLELRNRIDPDPNLAWYVIRYAVPQLLVWVLFVCVAIYGVTLVVVTWIQERKRG